DELLLERLTEEVIDRLFFSFLRGHVSTILLCFSLAGGERRQQRSALAQTALVQVILQLLGPGRVAQFAEGLRLDLADALARHVELATHLFQRAAAAVLEAKAKLQDAPLALRQRGEDVF